MQAVTPNQNLTSNNSSSKKSSALRAPSSIFNYRAKYFGQAPSAQVLADKWNEVRQLDSKHVSSFGRQLFNDVASWLKNQVGAQVAAAARVTR